jgi:UrcA family protein
MKNLITALIPGALLLGAVLPQPVSAQAAETPAAQAVGYADLDLSDPAGRAALQRRLRSAAREVCGPVYSFDLRGRNQARECVEATLASISLPRLQTASAE